MHPGDVELAVEHGADAVIVSNHGGRQLEGVVPTAVALPEIVAAASGRIPVVVDGGVRDGRDVLRALALGAEAAAIGRPYLWALALGGDGVVVALLERFRTELHNAMALTGQTAASAVPRDVVVADQG